MATFNGDTNNAAVTSGTAAETVNVDTINTTAGSTVVLGSGTPLTDSATLSGLTGTNPGGTVTFNLYAPTDTTYSNPIDTEPVSVSGAVNGSVTVSTPNGYVPTGSGILTGTYEWVATYSGDPNNYGVSSTEGSEPETISKGSSSVSTAIYDSTGGAVTSALGEQVYDTATVTGTPFTPTGTVTYYFYDTATPVYGTTTPASMQTVTLDNSGDVPNSAVTAALTAGSYSFIGVYSGDSNYTGYTGAVEPLTINQASSSVSTAIYDSTGGAVTNTLGESVYDTATVTGTPFTPTGTVTYYFYDTATPIYGTTTPCQHANGDAGQQRRRAQLGRDGSVDGGQLLVHRRLQRRQQLHGLTGAVEPLTISQASSSVSTAIYDSTGGAVTSALGESGLRHGDGDRHAVHADGHGDLLLLRHRDPGLRHDDAVPARRR